MSILWMTMLVSVNIESQKKEASTSIQNINSNLNKLFTYIFCMECEAFQSKILWTCKCNKE